MKKYLIVLSFLLFNILMLTYAVPVKAHRINVFAWVEGNTVHTESFFSDGTKAANARIEVFSPDDALLLEGPTDQEGIYVFETSVVADLKIVLNESTGHRAEYFLSASEFGGGLGSDAMEEKNESQAHEEAGQATSPHDGRAPEHADGRDDHDATRSKP